MGLFRGVDQNEEHREGTGRQAGGLRRQRSGPCQQRLQVRRPRDAEASRAAGPAQLFHRAQRVLTGQPADHAAQGPREPAHVLAQRRVQGAGRPGGRAAPARGRGNRLPAAGGRRGPGGAPRPRVAVLHRRGGGRQGPHLASRWATDTLPLQPDVLSILVGVNDFWHKLSHGYSGTVQQYEDQYVALLDETRRALPRVRLLVLEPFVLRCGAVDERWFPEVDERRSAARRVAQHAGASFVPLQAAFDDLAKKGAPQYWAADGVHPTPAGHAVIAEQWRRAARL